jgi:hypothetical protein
MKVPLTMFVGEPGRAFERVCLAFQAYGFEPPKPDEITGGNASGVYVSNILPQYQAALSQDETLAIIEFGLTHSVGDLEYYVREPRSLLHTVQELGSIYADTYAPR